MNAKKTLVAETSIIKDLAQRRTESATKKNSDLSIQPSILEPTTKALKKVKKMQSSANLNKISALEYGTSIRLDQSVL